MKENTNKPEFIVKTAENGKNYVDANSVQPVLHVTMGNSKTGPAFNYNISVFYSCDRRCECFKLAKCYAMGGCYNFLSNQKEYSENYKFFIDNNSADFVSAINAEIAKYPRISLFRWFTCGDIVNARFLACMVKIAIDNPKIRFWAYTKKYSIVNSFLDNGGTLPDNLRIVFSHWLNEDGTYFPMNNPYRLPTSEFIPMGKESLLENVTHICPCSDPSFVGTCATCDHPCHSLKAGESMALCEHSTAKTRKRDKELKEAKKAAKEAAKNVK